MRELLLYMAGKIWVDMIHPIDVYDRVRGLSKLLYAVFAIGTVSSPSLDIYLKAFDPITIGLAVRTALGIEIGRKIV